ncbi:MAG: DUF2165 family protein [Legionella sp.]
MIRQSKILCIAAMAFFSFLVAFGNMTDNVNFSALKQVLMMTDVFPDSLITYRAITNPVLHRVAYLIIIGFETLTAFLCALGALKLFRVRHASSQVFNQAKNWAVIGLTLGFFTWQVLFMSVGGEWFGMWMSTSLRGAITSSFQIFITFLGILIYLVIKDE